METLPERPKLWLLFPNICGKAAEHLLGRRAAGKPKARDALSWLWLLQIQTLGLQGRVSSSSPKIFLQNKGERLDLKGPWAPGVRAQRHLVAHPTFATPHW